MAQVNIPIATTEFVEDKEGRVTVRVGFAPITMKLGPYQDLLRAGGDDVRLVVQTYEEDE